MKVIKRMKKKIRVVEDILRRPNTHILEFPEGDSRVKRKAIIKVIRERLEAL